MAIKFDALEKETQQKKLQEQENKLAIEQNRKAKKIKVKTNKNKFDKWSNILLILSIIATIYAVSYTFSGLIILIPLVLLWTAWVVVAIVATVFTFCGVWFIDGFKTFFNGFTSFNNGISNGSVAIIDFMYKIFPYLAIFFSICVICYLILKINGLKHQIGESYKGKLVWSVILTILFIIAVIFDIVAFSATI